jgi:hypothetical protein
VKKQLIQLLQPLLSRCGLRLLRTKDYDSRCTREALLSELANASQQAITPAKKLQPEFIIFSKDRALQLHGLLSSLFHHVSGDYKLNVLYYASSEAHRQAYLEVKQAFKDQADINWIAEKNFRNDLINTLNQVERPEVCFLVDDIVFMRPINFEALDWPQFAGGILSLRLGKGITHCYTADKTIKPPTLTTVDQTNNLLQFSWSESTYDWGYPLSVDGHILPTHEIRIAAQALNYSAPNTFERALQIIRPLYLNRKGYCFAQPRLINIPLNRVQNEIENISGDISPEDLLVKWQAGQTLDFEQLIGVETNSVHQEITTSFCQR